MPKTERKTGFARLRGRSWPGALLGLIAAYALLVWIAPRMFDARALRKIMEDHLSYAIGAEVSAESLELDLTLLGTWRLRFREVAIENTSPDFGEELFACRKIVFEGNVFDLLHEAWASRILLKDWVVNIGLSEEGRTSLSDLFPPREKMPTRWNGWPFTEILRSRQAIDFENGQVRLTRGGGGPLWDSGRLDGRGRFLPSDGAAPAGGDLELRLSGEERGGADAESEAWIGIRRLSIPPRGLSGRWWMKLSLADFPALLAERLTDLPDLPEEARISALKIRMRNRFRSSEPMRIPEIAFSVAGVRAPMLGMGETVRVRVVQERPDAPPGTGPLLCTIVDPGNAFTVRIAPGEDGGRFRISGRCERFDFSGLPSDDAFWTSGWAACLLGRTGSAELECGQLRIMGVPVRDARVTAEMDGNAMRTLRVAGELAGGRVDFEAAAWPLRAGALPEWFGMRLRNAEAGPLLQAAAHLLPEDARIPPPTDGRLGAALACGAVPATASFPEQAGGDDADVPRLRDGETWRARLTVDGEVRLEDAGDHPLLKALWALPEGLKEAERQCLREESPDGSGPSLRLPFLRISGGSVEAAGGGEGLRSVRGELRSDPLGRILLSSWPPNARPVGGILFALHPLGGGGSFDEESGFPLLRPDVLAAFAEHEGERGLRILLRFGPEGRTVEPQYRKELPRAWRAH